MRKPARRTPRRVSRGVALGVSAVLAAGPLLAGCSGDEGSQSEGAPTPSAATEVATQVSFGKVAGRVATAQRKQLAADVRGVVDGWLDAAYVGGDYPRTDFADSWPGFTPGAAAQAGRDRDLMSNRDIGADIESVEPLRRAVRIDVLAAGREPVGVTAHVILRFDAVGAKTELVKVAGRLFLAEGKRGWQVFGYDMTKGTVR